MRGHGPQRSLRRTPSRARLPDPYLARRRHQRPPPGAAWLISVPPDAEGCPVFRSFAVHAQTASWIGYLSTTGVYGDLAGGWAFEETPLNPQSREATNRAIAEAQWQSLGARIFRLPGIYGPGRSALDRVKEPGARRIVKPGQVFSRAHVSDIAAALRLAIHTPKATGAFNICDDEPAPADEVLTYAAELLGIAPPPAVAFEDAGLLSRRPTLLRRVQARLERQARRRCLDGGRHFRHIERDYASAFVGSCPVEGEIYPTIQQGSFPIACHSPPNLRA